MTCKICNRVVPKLEDGLCSNCEFWFDITKKSDIHPIYNGNCYCLAENIIDNRTPKWNGFGGQWFIVIFNDGRVFYTNNLFHNGVIPDEWRSKLQDNCVITNIINKIDRAEIEQYSLVPFIRRKDVLADGMLKKDTLALPTELFT